MKKSICLTVFVLILSVIAVANAPAPTPKRAKKSKPPVVTTMSIRLDRDATEAKLIIPKSQLKQLRAELDELESDDDNTASAGSSGTQTIVSGIFLSLAFVFGGIWFVRSGKATAPGKNFVALAALAGIASAATFVYANVGPPPEARAITGKMFSDSMHRYKGGWGRVKIESSTDADQIEFIVPDPKPAVGE
jgi:hypothetical protein